MGNAGKKRFGGVRHSSAVLSPDADVDLRPVGIGLFVHVRA